VAVVFPLFSPDTFYRLTPRPLSQFLQVVTPLAHPLNLQGHAFLLVAEALPPGLEKGAPFSKFPLHRAFWSPPPALSRFEGTSRSLFPPLTPPKPTPKSGLFSLVPLPPKKPEPRTARLILFCVLISGSLSGRRIFL